jgi:hypothetical protein
MADTLDTAPPGRRRADARRSIDAILNAARTVLAERPDASMEDIAAAAGVTRQTVYAHFPSRDALIAALLHAAGAETLAAIDAARLDTAPPADALRQFLDIGWDSFAATPICSVPPSPGTRPAPTIRATPEPPGSKRSSGEASAPATSTAHSPPPGWPPPPSASSAPPPEKSSPAASVPARRPPCSWTARCDSAVPPAPAAVTQEGLHQQTFGLTTA